MRELDEKFPLIAFDTVNYGESYRTQAEPSIGLIAEAMLEALSALKIERFHTFGHHTGVDIAVDMALRAPDRVASVVSHGANYITMEENARRRKTMAEPNQINVKGTQFMWAWSRVKDSMGDVIWSDPPHAAEALHRETVDMLRAGENWNWGYRAVFAYDLIAAIKKVKCPLFLIGARREPNNSFDHFEHSVKDLPHARSYAHDAGGVYALETHPADFALEVALFISQWC